MTVPFLIQTSPQPAAPNTGATPKPDADKTGDGEQIKDFAQVLEDAPKTSARDAATERSARTAEAEEVTRKPAEGLSSAQDDGEEILDGPQLTPDSNNADLEAETSRKKIVIPDLPEAKQLPVQRDIVKENASAPARENVVPAQTDKEIPKVELVSTEFSQVSSHNAREGVPVPREPQSQPATARASSEIILATGPNKHPSSAGAALEPQNLPPAPPEQTASGAEDAEMPVILHRKEARSESTISAALAPRTTKLDSAVTVKSEAQTLHKRLDETPRMRSRILDRQISELTSAPPPPAAQPSVAPQPPAQTSQQIVQMVSSKELASKSLHAEGDFDNMQFDARAATSGSTSQATTPNFSLARADLPRSIAMQISDFARAMPDKPVDVSLNPEELGRVRLSISAGESGVTLSILAERPETLELMRRHADLLARELADLGFDTIDLAFGQGQTADEGDADPEGGKSSSDARLDLDLREAEALPDAAQSIQPRTIASSGGMDIRI